MHAPGRRFSPATGRNVGAVREPPNRVRTCAHPTIFPQVIHLNYKHFSWFGPFGRFANRPYMAR